MCNLDSEVTSGGPDGEKGMVKHQFVQEELRGLEAIHVFI